MARSDDDDEDDDDMEVEEESQVQVRDQTWEGGEGRQETRHSNPPRLLPTTKLSPPLSWPCACPACLSHRSRVRRRLPHRLAPERGTPRLR